MKNQYLFQIKFENRQGILNKITAILDRRRIEIVGINMAKTDLSDVMALIIEVKMIEEMIKPVLLQFKKVIEVESAKAILCEKAISQRLAFFKVSRGIFRSDSHFPIQKYGAQIIDFKEDYVVISKPGSEKTILELYNQLEGKHLLGFTQTSLITDLESADNGDLYRIMGLAA